MRSRSAGSVVSLYRRWSARSSSRDSLGFAANASSLRGSRSQVLDHAEADVPRARLDLRPEVVHEAADHLVGKPLQLRINLWFPGRQRLQMRLAWDQVHVHDQSAICREVVELQLRRAVEVAGRSNCAVARLRQRDGQLIEVDQAETELSTESHGHALGDGNECRRR